MTTSTVATQIATLRTDLMSAFPERANVIDGSIAAVLAGEHVMLLGPPGTAKSAIVRAFAGAFGGSYFERLVTKFSTPEELFGPVSLKALEVDSFRRVTTGKLPEAEFAFIDEIFKANSAILNTLLAVANERVFHNDGAPTKCPLVSMFAASNELPEGKELEALFDRFMVRFEVEYMARPANLRSVLLAGEPKATVQLTMTDLRAAQAQVAAVKITDATIDALIAIRDALKAEGVIVSDRRWKKALKLAQASAWLSGQVETSAEDLSFLSDALWREPKERVKVAKIVGQIADPTSVQAVEILDAARELQGKVNTAKAGTDRQVYMNAATKALADFLDQKRKLNKLANGGRRAGIVIADAVAEIDAMHADIGRAIATNLGLGK